MRVGIIGGGAAGMMAALHACQTHQVVLFERQVRLGRKLMATGNGRCNLSNRGASVSHYHGQQPDFVRPALERFGVPQTLAYFETLGLLTADEPDGKIYPFSNQANSVTDVLRLALEQSPCALHLGCEVQSVHAARSGFVIAFEGGQERVDRVIVTAGGLAGGRLGATGAGYDILKSFGHRCTKLYPSLSQLLSDPARMRSLKGVRCEARVVLLRDGVPVASEQGEVQFTEFGISGPCGFALARSCVGGGTLSAEVDLCPCLEEARLAAWLRDRQARFPAVTLENFLTGLLHNRLGRMVLRGCGYSLEAPCGELTARELCGIAAAIKKYVFPVRGAAELLQAQVTAGGMRTSEFDSETLESRLVPGLYAAGEVLDIDGDCGGFNLQWAWSSGALAGCLETRREGTI